MAKVKAWKLDDPTAPPFPDEFEIVKKAVLQVTEIKTNKNKYYGLELHRGTIQGGGLVFRVFSHYGRTDDLETNPDAGQKECRYCDDLEQAEKVYDSLYKQKTSAHKGYKEVNLASSKIGSAKARGTSSGNLDQATIDKMAEKDATSGAPKLKVAPKFALPPTEVQNLVQYIYSEATDALTKTVAATITAKGIETPLGVLTVGQIEEGEKILDRLWKEYKKTSSDPDVLEDLSGEYFTAIPHRIGRSRQAIQEAVIDTLEEFQTEQETLQLMKDMLSVNGDEGSVLYDNEVSEQYHALGCRLEGVPHDSPTYRELADYVEQSQIKTKTIQVKNIWSTNREAEHTVFTEKMGNQRLLFHGSNIKNWVGLLSRGILMPKIVVKMGVGRTDAGWLGNGIYFGDAACTSAFYTTPGQKKTRLMALIRVALGKMKEFTKITYGLDGPPPGYDSCHGVRRRPGVKSQFDDDEFVIYDTKQQRMDYLVEFTM